MIVSLRALAAVLGLSMWMACPQGALPENQQQKAQENSQVKAQEKPQENSQDKPKDAAPAAEPAKSDAAAKKNPVKATPEGLAAAKKFFGYDCAMCHGADGDGKGEVVESMKLTMKDWHDGSTLAGLSDGEIFEIIKTGKGKMSGEGDRVPAEMVWKLVNYVRTLAKQAAASR